MTSPAARTLRPEDEVSHYRIVGPLGAGGMGEVYLAQDRSLDRNVALKVLPPELVRSEERVRRFVLEAKSASSLSHPNIVTIYEIGHDSVRTPGEAPSDPVHFISMELVTGKTLSTLIHDDKTDLRTLLGHLAQAAEGLAKAHAAGIVHRDLKPGNIMVTSDGFAKVLDFGLAKLTEKRDFDPEVTSAPTQVADATGEGIVVGTVGYMSPEQVQGKAVDHRSDIFSLGCILYESATRRRPFAAETGIETMHKILNEKPAPVEESNPAAPAELRRLIRRCLAKAPDQRLQSMKDLAIELREIVDEFETLSVSGSSGSVATSAAPAVTVRQSSRMPWAIAGLVAVLGGVAAWWALTHRSTDEAQVTMRATTLTNRGDVRNSVLSPDGRYLAYLAGREGHTSLRVLQVATGSDVEVMPATDARIDYLSFAPDGNYLFYGTPRSDKQNYWTLKQIPSLGGASRERAFDVDSPISISPDGKRGAFWRHIPDPSEARLVVLDLESSTEKILAVAPNPENFEGGPAWSPDGRHIAAVLIMPVSNVESRIALFDAASGRRQDLAKLPIAVLTSLAWEKDGKGIVASGQDFNASTSFQINRYAVPSGRVSHVTNDFNDYSSVSTSKTDGAIAAVRRTRIANLWIADPAGGPARPLTSTMNPENSVSSVAAIDSATLVYVSALDRKPQVWSIPISGGAARPLTSGDASFNVVAAPGVIVFDRIDASGTHVWRMNPDGSGVRKLTSGTGEQSIDLSRDGRFVVTSDFASDRSAYLVSLEDGKVSHLEGVDGSIGFSPDSRSVLLAEGARDAQGLFYVNWRAHSSSGSPSTQTLRLPEPATNAGWAPDGSGMTFRNLGDPAWNVYRMAFGATTFEPVTHFTQGRVTGYAWSHDGTRLAVRLQIGNVSNVWVTRADGTAPVQVTQFSTENVFFFGWTPDDHRLYLTAGTSTSDAVVIRAAK